MASIRRRKDKWQVQVRRIGNSPVSRSFLHLKDAKLWAREMESRADRRDLPADPRALEKVTLGQLVERYRDTVAIRHRRVEIDRIVLNAFLRHPICLKRLSDVTMSDFASYRDERLKQIKPVSLKRDLGLIRHAFHVARTEWGLPLNDNLLATLVLKAPDQKRERRLRPGEWERLVEAARSQRNPYVLPVIFLAVETGMRRGEILGMKWDHLDRARQTLLIPETKTGYARRIPLSQVALDTLDALHPSAHRVFPMTANAFRLSWQRLKKRAGAEDLRFHDLRHEAVSRLFEHGLTVPEVTLISGHRDPRMLLRYSHASFERISQKLSGG
ncbi:MAG: site-specific integrase [Bauldia sp.]